MDISSRDVRGIGEAIKGSYRPGDNVTFGVVQQQTGGLETVAGGDVVYGGPSRRNVSGIPLQVNRGIVLGLGEMRIQDEYFRNPGVYAVLDDAGLVHPFYAFDFMKPDGFSMDRGKFAPWINSPRTRALVELRDMYDTTREAHDFLPGMLDVMVEAWNARRQLPLLALPYRYRVERNITEFIVVECLLEGVTALHKAMPKEGLFAKPKMVPIGTRATITKLGFDTEGEWKWSTAGQERDFLTGNYKEEDIYEPRKKEPVSLLG